MCQGHPCEQAGYDPRMEKEAEKFETLTQLAARFREDYRDVWAAQDGRFEPTPAADGEPANGRWEMIYWLAFPRDEEMARLYLETLGYGYQIMLDSFEQEYVVMTDFLTPTIALVYGR